MFLPRVIIGQAIGHQLLERKFVVFVSLEDDGARIGKAQALTHDERRDAEGGGDRVLALALIGQGLEGAELVERG